MCGGQEGQAVREKTIKAIPTDDIPFFISGLRCCSHSLMLFIMTADKAMSYIPHLCQVIVAVEAWVAQKNAGQAKAEARRQGGSLRRALDELLHRKHLRAICTSKRTLNTEVREFAAAPEVYLSQNRFKGPRKIAHLW